MIAWSCKKHGLKDKFLFTSATSSHNLIFFLPAFVWLCSFIRLKDGRVNPLGLCTSTRKKKINASAACSCVALKRLSCFESITCLLVVCECLRIAVQSAQCWMKLEWNLCLPCVPKRRAFFLWRHRPKTEPRSLNQPSVPPQASPLSPRRSNFTLKVKIDRTASL